MDFVYQEFREGKCLCVQNFWVLMWQCSKAWEWFEWLSVGSWLLHSHVWWLGWVIRRLGLPPECLHMASSCVLGFSQSGSWISEGHLEKDCSMRLRQQLQGFFPTRFRNHAVTPPLHCFGYKWVTNVGLSSKGGKLNSTSWWASGNVGWEIVLWAIFRK